MARRYGGKHSPGARPGGAATAPRPRRTRAGARVNILFLAPVPLVVTAFFREPVGLAFNLAAFGVLLLAAWLTREGLLAEEAYEARTVAKRPAIPRKAFASVLTGLGLFVAGYGGGQGLLNSAIFAVLGTLLHGAAFGLDPMRDKGVEGVSSAQSGRVAEAVDEAERHLSAMTDAIAKLGDRMLVARVARFQDVARAMFREVERDPRDLTAARRYLSVYLLGAKDATVKFVDLYSKRRDPDARADYETLLDDLENTYAARTEALMLGDRTDLDVEIEVLRERLEREGISTR